MAKSKETPTPSKSSASTKTTEKAASSVTSNPRLVAAIKAFDTSAAQTKSFYIQMAEVAQSEQCTKAEVVASLVEARGITPETASQQFTRHRRLFTDSAFLEKAVSGEIDIKQAREPEKKQKNPSAKKKSENLEKRMATGVKQLVMAAKEAGTDLTSLLNMVRAYAKKQGVK